MRAVTLSFIRTRTHWSSALLLTALLAGCAESDDGQMAHPGEDTYNRYCFSCHAAGIADAPKFADAAAWRPLIAKGEALLLQTTRDGIPPGMPAKGLCQACTDEELAAAIDYMIQATR